MSTSWNVTIPDVRRHHESVSEQKGVAFAVLGPVRAWRDGEELDLGSPQQRLTLAVLLLAGGKPVPATEIVEILWGENPPNAARGTVRTYVHRLRRVLEHSSDPQLLFSGSTGYALRVEEQRYDLGRFRALVRAADRARIAGDPHRSMALVREALTEWQDIPLAGLAGEWVEAEARRLKQSEVVAVEFLAELELDLGSPSEAVERLAAVIDAEPMRERAHELLMRGLYRSGRAAEALGVFETIRATLRAELGVDPGPALRTLHEQILRADPVLSVVTAPPPTGEPEQAHMPAPAPLRPAQLPIALPVFTGREAELADLSEWSRTGGARGVAVVHGTAGVGKTTFAVHWAHQVVSSFPDGQLYVNLRGFDTGGAVRQPAEVLRELLEALGVQPQSWPEDLDALTALYRSAVADRRLLVVLDNARDSAQVLPLLPGGTGCLVLVTSRATLTRFVAVTGAHMIELKLLSEQQSRDLMAARLGKHRVAAEPEAVRQIADWCARLPLALGVVCARIASSPKLGLATISEQLSSTVRRGLDFLATDDPASDVRSALSWSYQALSPDAARLFRLLVLLPLARTTCLEAASLAGQPVTRTQTLLAELVGSHMVSEYQSGRFSWHDLLKEYAEELLRETDSAEEVNAARRRLLDHHLASARNASSTMDDTRDVPTPAEISPDVSPVQPAERHAAFEWFAAEHATLVALIQWAADRSMAAQAWRLAWYLRRYLDWAGHWSDMTLVNEAALRVSVAAGDHSGIGYTQRCLARVDYHFGQYEAGIERLDVAAAAFRNAGDGVAVAYVLRQAAGVHQYKSKFDDAIACATRARELFRLAGMPDGEGTVLAIIADCHRSQEHYDQALADIKEACRLGGTAYDEWLRGETVAKIYEKRGDFVRAAEANEECLRVMRELVLNEASGARYTYLALNLIATNTRLARVLHLAGQFERAADVELEVLKGVRSEIAEPQLIAGAYSADDLRVVEALAALDACIGTASSAEGWIRESMEVVRRVAFELSGLGLSVVAMLLTAVGGTDAVEFERARSS
ncbi:BTAD domain-containing putative transcriptional regulator [Lentzea sp. NPDC034063]|uniref:AfsR/SARP family transcriptional regulator n=1 Tax=unclassified Lentzea TaxID=2643253 RepID=UPI00340E5A6D